MTINDLKLYKSKTEFIVIGSHPRVSDESVKARLVHAFAPCTLDNCK